MNNKRKEIRVSVVVSVWNGQDYLEEALKSLAEQRYDSFEVIIVDDGSTDDSLAITRRFCEADNRFLLIQNEANEGQPRSRNKAMELAKGEFIAVMDADDIALDSRLTAQVDFLDAHPEIGLVGTTARIIDSKGTMTGEVVGHGGMKGLELEWEEVSRYHSSLVHPSVMFRKELVGLAGGAYNPDFPYAQDKELWTRFYLVTSGYVIDQPLLLYRRHDGSVSGAKTNKQRACAESIINAAWKMRAGDALDFQLICDTSQPLKKWMLRRYSALMFLRRDAFSSVELVKVISAEYCKYIKRVILQKEIAGFPVVTITMVKSLLLAVINLK